MKEKKTMTGEQVKAEFRKRGITLSSWAEQNKFPYPIVSGVVRGTLKGNFGVAHDVAVALKMKAAEPETV